MTRTFWVCTTVGCTQMGRGHSDDATFCSICVQHLTPLRAEAYSELLAAVRQAEVAQDRMVWHPPPPPGDQGNDAYVREERERLLERGLTPEQARRLAVDRS